MPPLLPAAYFARRGLLQIQTGLLAPDRIDALASAMRAAAGRDASVYYHGRDGELSHLTEQRTRRTRELGLPQSLADPVRQRLLERLPELNQAFGVAATGLQDVQFLRYEPGDYFRAHRDWAADAPARIPPRLISFVLFVNLPGDPACGGYRGGELVFYPPRRDGALEGLGLQPEAGLLVCFHPELLHEVRLVSAGDRLSVAGWFC